MEPDSKPRIRVSNRTGARVPSGKLRRAVAAALRLHGRPEAEVSVLLAGDEEVRALNAKYRLVDEATDVLSFPTDGMPGASLGDVAIAVPFAMRQADARGVSLDVELAFLGVHGVLHLLGFEDESDSDCAAMQREMERAGLEAGLPAEGAWRSLLPGGAA